METAIPPTGKREADPPTAEEEQDAKKLKHGEEEEEVDIMDLFKRYLSESDSDHEAKQKILRYCGEQRITPKQYTDLCMVIRGSPLPPPDYDKDNDPEIDVTLKEVDESEERRKRESEEELPRGYGWAYHDPFIGSERSAVKMTCARCGKFMDHWTDKCPEKQGEGSLFKRYGWIKPSASTDPSP